MSKKQLLFKITTVSLILLIGLIIVFFILKEKQQTYQISKSWLVKSTKTLYKPDPLLGFSVNPGKYKITISVDAVDEPLEFDATIGDDGNRITSENPERMLGKPEIWIFGCSLTWGWPLNDDETWPWLIQHKTDKYYIRNFACNGYGTIHAYLLLKDLMEKKSKKPEIILFTYASIHLARNAATSSWMRSLHVLKDAKKFKYPKAFINNQGELETKLIPIRKYKAGHPSLTTQIEITKKIFSELYNICKNNGINTYIISFGKYDSDKVMSYCAAIGFKTLDMELSDKEGMTCMPWDRHPNAKAHKIWAAKLAKELPDFFYQ